MSVYNNLSAMAAHRQTLINQQLMQTSLKQLSSGYRINSAKDDPAGLAISEKMRAQQTAYERAVMNAQDGVSLVQTADGALSTMHSKLNRLTELATQAANGTLGDTERQILNNEAQEILSDIDRISKSTNFNGIQLLDGSLSSDKQISVSGMTATRTADSVLMNRQNFGVFDGQNAAAATFQVNGKSFMLADAANYDAAVTQYADAGVNVIRVDGSSGASLTGDDMQRVASTVNAQTGLAFEPVAGGMAMKVGNGLRLQVGETADEFNKITVSVGNMSASGLGLAGLDLTTQGGAASAIDLISGARERVSSARGDLGATQNRLDSTINNLGVSNENIMAAESRIRDVDMAKAFMEYTKQNMLGQVGMAMMAQGNLQQQQVLQLLR
ncbi:flagellin [Ruminococcaceae bacterium OttesenSCG-928-I18]|nr:flagellin [Ruminococcaceae bacterium OttesenSCG-928-I18]